MFTSFFSNILKSLTEIFKSYILKLQPQQSGTPHRVSGEIKHEDDIVYRISGEWNNNLQFISSDVSFNFLLMINIFSVYH